MNSSLIMDLFDIHSLTFLKSYNKGHSMDHVRHGLMSGVDLAEIFSGGTKNKVLFFVRSSAGTVSK